ncbi:MAG: hypothetical protein EAZ32_13195 [Cytophagia bacterium]|nr:MAG: hypothetical protein EAZ38_14305 [Cytophagales bacterium]TAG38191.1 MAG: hypothetical protein EAZ32_13195 [Cytophagia bacterium]
MINTVNKRLIFFLSVGYIIVSFLPNTDISFVLLGIFLLFFSAFLKNIKGSFFFSIFILLYLVLFLVAHRFWSEQYDKKDIIAVLLFFSIIPVLFNSLTILYRDIFQRAIIFSWFLLSICLCLWGGVHGIDFQRSKLLGFDDLHKNSVANFFEIGFVITFFSEFSKVKAVRVGILSVAFISMLYIGSKTTIILITCLVLIPTNMYKKWLPYFPLFIFFILLYLFFNLDYIYDLLSKREALFTASLRIVLWERAISDILVSTQTFIFGIGPGNFDTKGLNIGDLSTVESPHNYILTILNAYGMLGITIFGWYFIKIFTNVRKPNFYVQPYLISYTIFFCHSLFDVGWVKSQGFFIAMITGLMFNENFLKNENSNGQRP